MHQSTANKCGIVIAVAATDFALCVFFARALPVEFVRVDAMLHFDDAISIYCGVIVDESLLSKYAHLVVSLVADVDRVSERVDAEAVR